MFLVYREVVNSMSLFGGFFKRGSTVHYKSVCGRQLCVVHYFTGVAVSSTLCGRFWSWW